MAFWDGLLTFSIVVAAAYYLFRRFRKVDKEPGCGGCGNEHCTGEHKSSSAERDSAP